jgi:hypothetical protein
VFSPALARSRGTLADQGSVRSILDSDLRELEDLGIGFVSLTEALDLTTPAAPESRRDVGADAERRRLQANARAGSAPATANS